MSNKIDYKRELILVMCKRNTIQFNSKATASVLTLEVAKLIISDEVPPIIPRSTYAASHAQDLMYHSYTMIKLIMSRKVNKE